MRLSNFHTHSYFCDGAGRPEEYIQKAIDLGFEAIGFSGHAPTHFDCPWNIQKERLGEYCSVINMLKMKYKNIIEVYLGLEIDYFSKEYGPGADEFKCLGLDFKIGSIHFMKDKKSDDYLAIDGSEDEYVKIINNNFNGNVRDFVTCYYDMIRNMVNEHEPDIIGHIDLIKKNNKDSKYFSENEKWYKEEVLNILTVIAKSNSILEVNTGGISRKYIKELYPSEWILKECRMLNIPLILSSDAHSKENLNFYFKESVEILRDCGYNKLYSIKNSIWESSIL